MSRIACRVILAALALGAVATARPAWAGHRALANPAYCPPDGAYVAYRPAYRVPGTKPLYLNNYAGTYYPPLGAGPVLNPTAYRPHRVGLFAGHKGW